MARFSSLDEWLAWQETCHPKEIDLGLERIRTVAQRLQLLTPDATVVTVAGTNGKGSCVATLSQGLISFGKKVGAFTSPHIEFYNERIVVQGKPVTDEVICAAFEAIDQARGEISLSYFEFGTLAAFYIFNQNELDVWVLEVGLGGRLDAVNILDADIAVITRVDIDHVEWLGDDREKIGLEKAGICRPNQTVVVADNDPPRSVKNRLRELACSVHYIGKDFNLEKSSDSWHYASAEHSVGFDCVHLPPASVAAGLKVLEILLPEKFSAPQMLGFVNTLHLAGRFQRFDWLGRPVILDVAHNPAAVSAFVKRVQTELPKERFITVLGMMRDKNIVESIEPLLEITESFALVNLPGSSRAATADELGEKLQSMNTGEASWRTFENMEDAMGNIKRSDKTRTILICGSFITVAQALSALNTYLEA